MREMDAIIDLAIYPLDDAEGRASLVAEVRRSLAEGGFVRLPGFVLPAAARAMAREAESACAAGGFRRDYLWRAKRARSAGGASRPPAPSLFDACGQAESQTTENAGFLASRPRLAGGGAGGRAAVGETC
jgi:hypothetical protein